MLPLSLPVMKDSVLYYSLRKSSRSIWLHFSSFHLILWVGRESALPRTHLPTHPNFSDFFTLLPYDTSHKVWVKDHNVSVYTRFLSFTIHDPRSSPNYELIPLMSIHIIFWEFGRNFFVKYDILSSQCRLSWQSLSFVFISLSVFLDFDRDSIAIPSTQGYRYPWRQRQ